MAWHLRQVSDDRQVVCQCDRVSKFSRYAPYIETLRRCCYLPISTGHSSTSSPASVCIYESSSHLQLYSRIWLRICDTGLGRLRSRYSRPHRGTRIHVPRAEPLEVNASYYKIYVSNGDDIYKTVDLTEQDFGNIVIDSSFRADTATNLLISSNMVCGSCSVRCVPPRNI
jgi:hypothetical protein